MKDRDFVHSNESCSAMNSGDKDGSKIKKVASVVWKIVKKFLIVIGAIISFILFQMFLLDARRVSRKAVRESYVNSYETSRPKTNTIAARTSNSQKVSHNSSKSNSCASDKSDSDDAEIQLRQTTKEINRTLPQKVNDDITQCAIELTPSALVYEFRLRESVFMENKALFTSKQGQLNRLRLMYSDMKPMIDLLLKTKRGISYKYVSSESHSTVIMEISYSELANL